MLRRSRQYEKFLKGDQFKQLKAGVSFVSSILETSWDDGLRKLAGSGVALAVEVEPGKGPWGFIAVTPTDPAFLTKAHAKFLELARNDASTKGNPDPIRESTHQGVTIYGTWIRTRPTRSSDDTLVISQSTDGREVGRSSGPRQRDRQGRR